MTRRQRHIFTFIFRVVLLGAAVLFPTGEMFRWLVWLYLAADMLWRLVPNRRIALGARKHFACSFKAVETAEASEKGEAAAPPADTRPLHRGAALSLLGWLAGTAAIIAALFFTGRLTANAVFILMLVYAVTDIGFILFFCPFRHFFMKHNCCAHCRIYNWDYFFMCAPLMLFPGLFSISLFALAVAVLLRWEVALWRHPERFSPTTNANLQCAHCTDKLCKRGVN